MTKKDKIDISNFSTDEKKIIKLLEIKGEYLYGNIFKELKLSQIKGTEAILSLTKKKVIKNVGRTSYYQLNVELE